MVLDWILENQQWLFSGAAVAIPIAILGWLWKSRSNKSQVQKGGKNSTNIQVGGDLNYRSKDE